MTDGNPYIEWNKEHAFDARKAEKKSRKAKYWKPKKQRQEWWRNLTPEQQEQYIQKRRAERAGKAPKI